MRSAADLSALVKFSDEIDMQTLILNEMIAAHNDQLPQPSLVFLGQVMAYGFDLLFVVS